MKLLHVDASPKGEKSNSRMLSRYFVSQLQQHIPAVDITYLDLAETPIDHVTGEFVKATYTPEEDRTPAMRAVLAPSDALCEQLLNADALLFAMPMYNWSMPSVFKAYIDTIIRTNLTYTFGAEGNIIGKLTRQKTLFLTTRGTDSSPGSPFAGMDALTPALRAAFKFIGVEHPDFVNAEPMEFVNQAARARGIARAKAELETLALQWSV